MLTVQMKGVKPVGLYVTLPADFTASFLSPCLHNRL